MRKITAVVIITLFIIFLTFQVAGAITNGHPDYDNLYPYVGMVVSYTADGRAQSCSGTAISPTEVLSSAHCFIDIFGDGSFIGNEVYLSFQSNVTDFEYIGTAYIHPEFPFPPPGNGIVQFNTHDIAIVKILVGGPLPGPYPSLPEIGFVDSLPMKQDLTAVGYGIHGWVRGEGNPHFNPDFDMQRYFALVQKIDSKHVISDEYLKLTANPAQGKGGICMGDSGGPALLENEEGVTILGMPSIQTNINCAGITYSNRIDLDYALDFIMGGYLDN